MDIGKLEPLWVNYFACNSRSGAVIPHPVTRHREKWRTPDEAILKKEWAGQPSATYHFTNYFVSRVTCTVFFVCLC